MKDGLWAEIKHWGRWLAVWYRARMRREVKIQTTAAYLDAAALVVLFMLAWSFFVGVDCGQKWTILTAYKIVRHHGARD